MTTSHNTKDRAMFIHFITGALFDQHADRGTLSINTKQAARRQK
jgi:hypothetical protein